MAHRSIGPRCAPRYASSSVIPMAQRTIRDERGQKWDCRVLGSGDAQKQQAILECRTDPTKSPVLLPVGTDWEALSEDELARRILMALDAEK
jgi:hypothetical protein